MSRYFGQLLLVVAFAATGWVQAAWSQDLIGVLPEVLKPEVAERLKLSDDQRTKLAELIKRRNSDAIGLAQQLREVPPDQKESLRDSFRVESERLAIEMLSPEQRETFEQVRVNRLGLLSLSESDIGKKLNLADWQKAKVAELVAKANAASRSANAERVRSEVERGLRSEISDSQWAAWQVLSGRSPGKDLGSPQPPERKVDATVSAQAAPAGAAAAANKAVSADRLPVSEVQLQMNFQATPWPEVLKWLCEQADLSLQADAMPTGSFTYRDNSRKYSVGEALDIMSASLLNKGYSLLRRQRLLMVVDLESPMVENMIGELAEFVTPEQLEKRGDFELVKCLFYLSRMNPDEAKKEVEQLLSLQGSVISLPSAGQIQVTDTAGVLRAVQALIKRAEDPESMRGSSIVAITLSHITANEVLDVARPLLNLPEGVNSNQDISLSTDTFGNTIFVNAKKTEDVQKLRDLVKHLDMAVSASEQVGGTRELPIVQIHEIKGSDPDLAFRVLSQRLSSETDVRMELDKETSKLVVQARPATHKEIDEVLAMLGGQSSSFEVIDLKNLDTQLAIATIKKFFGLSDTGSAAAGQPIIDGDLLMRRLYVKAEPKQLEQIRTLIEKLEMNSASSNLGDNVRMIPLPTRKFDRTIEQIEQLWQATKKRNRLRVVTPGELVGESALPQKAISPDDRDRLRRAPETTPQAKPQTGAEAKPGAPAPKQEPTRPQARMRRPIAKLVSLNVDEVSQADSSQAESGQAESPVVADDVQTPDASAKQTEAARPADGQGDDIVIMQGPGGLIVTSNDAAALAEFDKLLRLLLEQSAAGSTEPNFYWLKYRTAAAAKELLESILSGTTSSGGGGGGGGLIGDMVSEVGGGLLGSLLGGGGGGGISSSGASLTTGDVLINADPTLNALIIRANPLDLELCEQLLRVIDQPDSPISVRTRGVIDVIPVLSQDADAVAAVVRGLFGDRIEGGGGGGGGGSQPRAPDPRELIQALTGGGGSRRGGGSSQLSPPKIAVSVDKNTNSLIVMAQPQDIELIRELVESLDGAGGDVEELVTVVSLKDTNLNVDMIGSALKGVLGAKAKTSNTASSSSSGGSSQGSQSSGGGDSDQARRTAEFFQQMRDRMQGGGGGPGGSSSGRPPFSPFGGGGFPFGGSRGGPPSGGSSSSQGGRGGR